MFSPLQLRPRMLLGHVSSGFSRWLAEYVTPFPSMLDTYGSAVVVASVRIDYATPCPGFSDAPWLTVRCGLRVHPSGKWMYVDIDCTADGRPVAHVFTTMRVLAVADGDSLSASPGVLHPELHKAFTPAETAAAPRPAAPNPGEGTAVLPPTQWRTFISRSHAEVADQWSFIEMIELATQSRDRLFAERLHAPLPPRQVIGTPTRTLHAVFRRPMFVYDPCVVTTSAHRDPAALYFHHRIGLPDSARPHLTVWETVDPTA